MPPPQSQFPSLVSHGLPSCLAFAFTPLRLSYLCRSQSVAVSRSLSTLCHQAVTLSMPFHIYLPLRLLLVSVSLALIVFFLSIEPSHWSHFVFAVCSVPAFFLRTTFMCCCIFSPLCPCFSFIQLPFYVLSVSDPLKPVLKCV